GERSAGEWQADHGLRPSHLPGRGSTLPDSQAHRQGARFALRRRRGEARAGCAGSASGASPGACPRNERRVLLGGCARRRRHPTRSRAGDVRVLARGGLVGPHPGAEAHRQALPALGALRRSYPALAELGLTLQEAAVQAQELAEQGAERELADLRAKWADEIESDARSSDYRQRAVAYRAIGQFRFRQKLELLGRGLQDESPSVRGSALVPLELLSRDAPAPVNASRSVLHRLLTGDDHQAVRRLAIVCLRNGSPH